MELLANDRSLHGQFQDVSSFRDALGRLMQIRAVARRFGRELYCHRGLAAARATAGQVMSQVVGALPIDERRAVMLWLTRQGPFWDDVRRHGPEEYLAWRDDVVTDSAIGEAAWCRAHGINHSVVSISPSAWECNPLAIDWHPDGRSPETIEVDNFWFPDAVESALASLPAGFATWSALRQTVVSRFENLLFAEAAFESLEGHPFYPGAAQRIVVLLDTLNRFVAHHNEKGERDPEALRIYQDHFTGSKAWFSDSSDAEKVAFERDLTFREPGEGGRARFCPWHGKVKTPQLRIHFEFPLIPGKRLAVVYVGPKITKR